MDRLKLFVLAEAVLLAALGAAWIFGRGTDATGGSNALRSLPADAERRATIVAGGAGGRVERSELSTDSEAPRVASDPDLGVCVCGTVRGRSGQVLAEASVSFVREGRWCTATTAANGVYAITGLAPGTWELRASAEGHARLETERAIEPRAWQTIDVELEPWYAVRVRIDTKSGEPLGKGIENLNMMAAPYVVATVEPLEGDLPATESSRVHLFGVGAWKETRVLAEPTRAALASAGYAGELHLDREPPIHASLMLRHVRLATQRIEIGQRELRFTIDPSELQSKLGSVRIRVVDRDSGAPLGGVAVRIETAQGGGSFATTDAEGRAFVERVLPGIGLVDIGAKDREMLWFHTRVPIGAEVDLGEIALSAMFTISGRVLDERGAPAPGTDVMWTDLDRRTWPSPLSDRRSAGVDAEGRFQIQVGPHRYAIQGRDREGRRAYALLDARDGTAKEVVLKMQSSTYVRLRYDPAACRGHVLVVHTEDEAPIQVVPLDGLLLARGFAVPPGRYIARVFDAADQIVKSSPFTVGNEIGELSLP